MCSGGSKFYYNWTRTGSVWLYEKFKKTDLNILIYSGTNDLLLNPFETELWINKLKWKRSRSWTQFHLGEESSLNTLTYEDEQIAGFFQQYNQDKFTFAIIHNAGHMVPQDKPEQAYHIIFNWLNKRNEFDQEFDFKSYKNQD